RRSGRARGRSPRRRAGTRRADMGGFRIRTPRALSGDRVILRRGRFRDLVDRQLGLFAAETELLSEAAAAEAAWARADAAESEERYGDYQLVVDAVGEQLHDIRETYAATLDDEAADEYRRAFDRASRKRFGRLTSFLDEDS